MLRAGHIVHVLRKKGAWLEIKLPKGKRGWIHADYVSTIYTKERGRKKPPFWIFVVLGIGFLTYGLVKRSPRVVVRNVSARPVLVPVKKRSSLSRRILIRPHENPYWQEQGWGRVNGKYVGHYNRKYQGEVVATGGNFQFFIFNPPKGIKRHSHSRCFISRGNGKFFIHFSPPEPDSLDSGILAIENILKEAERC